MKIVLVIAAFFLVPGLIGAAFAALAILGELANPEHSVGTKLAYSAGVLFLPSVFLGLGGLLLWAGFKNRNTCSGRPPSGESGSTASDVGV